MKIFKLLTISSEKTSKNKPRIIISTNEAKTHNRFSIIHPKEIKEKKTQNTYQTRGEQNYKIKRGNTNFALRVLFPVVAIAELNDG